MDRVDRSGLAVAVLGHLGLFAALSVGLLNAPRLDIIMADPIEVELVEDVALVSTAPDPVAEVPASAPAAASEPEPMAMAEPVPPAPVAEPQTRPAPTPKPVRAQPQPSQAKPAAKPQPQQRTQTAQRTTDNRDRRRPDRSPGLSRDLVSGLSDAPSAKPAAKPGRGSTIGTPAATAGPAVTASLGAEVRRQIKPHWKSPTGADVELLRTTVVVRLNPDGTLAGAPSIVQQTGVNDSNRAQARLHADQAIKAVRLAAPFQLPAQFYDAWKEIRPTFDRRLSQ
jgi:outer membrane biosynthesis protein TonB